MKKIAIIILATIMAAPVYAFDLSSLLKGMEQASKNTTDSTSTAQTGSDKAASALSGLGTLLGGVVESLTATSKLTPADLVGTWTYSSPAVTFDSDNALQKIGGAAATATLEQKIAPYYQRAGVTNLVLTVDADSSFTMKTKLFTVKGTIATAPDEGKLIFNFKAFNKIKIGEVSTMVSKSGDTVALTFDASRLQGIVTKISALSQNASVQSLAKLFASYDGVYVGFKLKKEQND